MDVTHQAPHPFTEGRCLMSEEGVRRASAQFYEALNRMLDGDSRSMAEIWSHSATVTAMHPIGGRQVGWDQVRESFAQVAELASGGEVKLRDQLIRVAGDVGYELGIEQGQFELAGEQVSVEHRVTNIYRQEGGTWKIVHHHTDLSPAMMDILRRLEADA
jgi:ketosteroid isomerase-like protein